MSDGQSIFLAVAGTAAGAVASWYFSRQYYLKSGTDLAVALHPLVGNDQKTLQAVNAIGRIVEQNSQGKLAYDEAGNITGIVITGSARLTASASLRATGTVTGPPQYDRQHEQPPPVPEGDHA